MRFKGSNVLVYLTIIGASNTICSAQTKNRCEDLETCSKCIQERDCVWCSEPYIDKEIKCRLDVTDENLLLNWCPAEQLMKPKSKMEILENKPFNDGKDGITVQLKPQRVHLQLRRGEAFNLSFQYSRAANYPVDLYYIMDMSDSMKIHKKTLAGLGEKLAEVMINITTDFRLGFGSFVDKVQHPFVNVHKRFEKLCAGCTKAYSFKNHLSLNNNSKLFSRKVNAAQLSRNIDFPEGGFDALMQAMVCKEDIGWRSDARHLLVFSTDADSHIAGDGRLVGAVWPNDGKCRLENNFYNKSLEYDYPSVSHINHIAKENNINLIFAIVPKVRRAYRGYKNLIENNLIENSKIGKLDTNSKNIVDMVVDNYNKIVDSVRITSNASKSIDIKYQSSCKQVNSCTNIQVGEIVNFTATIRPLECKNETVQFKPEGVAESLLVDLEIICNCDCENPNHRHYDTISTDCNSQGSKSCGVCQCNPDYIGSFCECHKDSYTTMGNKTMCSQEPNGTVCSNNGICKCGKCFCDKPNYGKYCECNDYSCKRLKGLVCSGEDHGKCECGQCRCSEGWTGDDCGCVDNLKLCVSPSGNREVCSGHGNCVCGQCECTKDENGYFGKYCEECPKCEGQRCTDLRPCVECQVFKTGRYSPKECQDKCAEFKSITIEKIQDTNDNPEIKTCTVFDDVSCTISFQYQYHDENQLIVEVQTERRCYEPIDLIVVGLSILGSVILIGLITLIVWKIITSIHDKIEYQKFEKERMESKWHTRDNPLFVGASSTFQNPTYRK